MAEIATQTVEKRASAGRPYFPWISWGAIFGGLASGLAVFMLLALFGLAVGFTAIDPQAAEPVGGVGLFAGIWTGVSMIAAAFVGGYVASRMSGMSRRNDGIMHGLVAWGALTLAFLFLVTTSVGALLGGAFNVLGQGAQVLGTVAGTAAGGVGADPQARGQLESLITGAEGGEVSAEAIGNLQQQLSAGDREGAINVMVNQMGFTRDRAEPVVDQAMGLFATAQQLPQQAREMADAAVTAASRAAWFIFIGLLISLALGIVGGLTGAKASISRRHIMAH